MSKLLLKRDSKLDERESPSAWMKPAILTLQNRTRKAALQVRPLPSLLRSQPSLCVQGEDSGLLRSPAGRGRAWKHLKPAFRGEPPGGLKNYPGPENLIH